MSRILIETSDASTDNAYIFLSHLINQGRKNHLFIWKASLKSKPMLLSSALFQYSLQKNTFPWVLSKGRNLMCKGKKSNQYLLRFNGFSKNLFFYWGRRWNGVSYDLCTYIKNYYKEYTTERIHHPKVHSIISSFLLQKRDQLLLRCKFYCNIDMLRWVYLIPV